MEKQRFHTAGHLGFKDISHSFKLSKWDFLASIPTKKRVHPLSLGFMLRRWATNWQSLVLVAKIAHVLLKRRVHSQFGMAGVWLDFFILQELFGEKKKEDDDYLVPRGQPIYFLFHEGKGEIYGPWLYRIYSFWDHHTALSNGSSLLLPVGGRRRTIRHLPGLNKNIFLLTSQRDPVVGIPS